MNSITNHFRQYKQYKILRTERQKAFAEFIQLLTFSLIKFLFITSVIKYKFTIVQNNLLALYYDCVPHSSENTEAT